MSADVDCKLKQFDKKANSQSFEMKSTLEVERKRCKTFLLFQKCKNCQYAFCLGNGQQKELRTVLVKSSTLLN